MVRALKWDQKDVEINNGLTFETLLPGEMGSYGGWWVSVYDTNALASAQASDAELLAITHREWWHWQPLHRWRPPPILRLPLPPGNR